MMARYKIERHESEGWVGVMLLKEDEPPRLLECETLDAAHSHCYSLTQHSNKTMIFRAFDTKLGVPDPNLFTEGGAWIFVG